MMSHSTNVMSSHVISIHLRNDLYCVRWGIKLYSLTHVISIHLRNDLYCVGWGVKLYSLTSSACLCATPAICAEGNQRNVPICFHVQKLSHFLYYWPQTIQEQRAGINKIVSALTVVLQHNSIQRITHDGGNNINKGTMFV